MSPSSKHHNPTTLGYMPLKSNYGFLTPQATTRDAAHELGHGKFNLRHTFSPHNPIILKEGTTQNLMDYSIGTELFKYQWDFIHNPEGGWFVFEDEEEGAFRKKYSIRQRIADKLDIDCSTNFMIDDKSGEVIIQRFIINNSDISGEFNDIKNFEFTIAALIVHLDKESNYLYKELKTLFRKGSIVLADYNPVFNYLDKDVVTLSEKKNVSDVEGIDYYLANDPLIKLIGDYNKTFYPMTAMGGYYSIYSDINNYENDNILTFIEKYGADVVNLVLELFSAKFKVENIFDANWIFQNVDIINKHFYYLPYLKEDKDIKFIENINKRGPVIMYQ